VAAARAQVDSIRKQLAPLKGKATGPAAAEIESFTKNSTPLPAPSRHPRRRLLRRAHDRPLNPPPPRHRLPTTRASGRELRRRPPPPT
jgi:hypothetical protein